MAAKKIILWGCGTGCGLLLLVAIAIPVAGALFVGSAVEELDNAVAARELLEERFGTSDTFEPWPDGPIPAERIEAFLVVRNAMQPARETLAGRFETLFNAAAAAQDIEDKGVFAKLRFALGVARTGAGMAPDIGTFFEVRNTALLENEMGLGEYTYLYVLGYYSALEHSPDDGPENAAKAIEEFDDNDVNLQGLNTSSRRVRRDMRAMLRSQLEALPAESTAADAAWREALATEVAMLESKRSRLPWQDGLPDTLVASLAPYRERMEATYNPVTNSFELSRNEKRGKFSFSSD